MTKAGLLLRHSVHRVSLSASRPKEHVDTPTAQRGEVHLSEAARGRRIGRVPRPGQSLVDDQAELHAATSRRGEGLRL